MNEEVNNLNTDLKELFIDNKHEELYEKLDQTADNIIMEITLYNYEIIKKYFESQKFNLLIQYIKFVAFSSFLCEYSAKRNLIDQKDFDDMLSIFTEIHNLFKQNKEF